VSALRTTQPDLAGYLDELRLTVELALERAVGAVGAANLPGVLAEAMRYALLGGGKRLRPSLTLAAADSAGARRGLDASVARSLALPSAVAVEMIHCYSLVHDDLPAMDDDALRRGRPTAHVVYGDGMAILAGDGLLTDAFELLTRSPSPLLPPDAPEPPIERKLRAVAVLAGAAGSRGMVGGQAIDLAAAGRVQDRPLALDAPALEDMHRRKTGALIRAAATLGAIAVGADDRTIGAVDDYARDLGLAFQIVDDVLDVEGSPDALGKTAGKDAAAGKPTYPAFFGLDGSRALAAAAVTRAKQALAAADLGGRLAEIADWSLGRRS
jgi:geranylgeranyl pyrophosphate synthase